MRLIFVGLVAICCLTGSVQAQIAYEPISIQEKGFFKKKFYERCDVEMDELHLIKLLQ